MNFNHISWSKNPQNIGFSQHNMTLVVRGSVYANFCGEFRIIKDNAGTALLPIC